MFFFRAGSLSRFYNFKKAADPFQVYDTFQVHCNQTFYKQFGEALSRHKKLDIPLKVW